MITLSSSGSASRRSSFSDSDVSSGDDVSSSVGFHQARVVEQTSQAHAHARAQRVQAPEVQPSASDPDGILDKVAVFHAPQVQSGSQDESQAQARAQRELVTHQCVRTARRLEVLLGHPAAECGTDAGKMKALGWALHCEWEEFHGAVGKFMSSGESLIVFAEMIGRVSGQQECDELHCTNLPLKVMRSSLERDFQPADKAEERESTEVWSRASLAFFQAQSGKKVD